MEIVSMKWINLYKKMINEINLTSQHDITNMSVMSRGMGAKCLGVSGKRLPKI